MLLLFLYCARHGVFAGHTGDCARRRRFHASAIASERRSSPRGRPRSFPGRPNPPFSSSVHDEPSSSEQHRATAAARRTGKSSPPQLDSSCSEPLHLAPKPHHPSTSAAVPYPGRNRVQTAARHRRPPSSSAPSFTLTSTTPFRPSSAQNRSTVSSAATLSHFPTLSPP